jgi:hypothetical protein
MGKLLPHFATKLNTIGDSRTAAVRCRFAGKNNMTVPFYTFRKLEAQVCCRGTSSSCGSDVFSCCLSNFGPMGQLKFL